MLSRYFVKTSVKILINMTIIFLIFLKLFLHFFLTLFCTSGAFFAFLFNNSIGNYKHAFKKFVILIAISFGCNDLSFTYFFVCSFQSIMLDNTIHQSASFKRLMHNMAVGPESTDDQTDF